LDEAQSASSSGYLYAIDGVLGVAVGRESIGSALGVAVDQTTGNVFVVSSETSAFGLSYTSLPATTTVTGAVPLAPYTSVTGHYNLGVAFDSSTDTAYVSNTSAGTVSAVDVASGSVASTVTVGTQPYGVAYDSANDSVYVANWGSSSVSVIDDQTNAVVATIPVGIEPTQVAVDATTDTIYVANSAGSSVSVISGASNSVTSTFSFGTGNDIGGVAVDGATGSLYVSLYPSQSSTSTLGTLDTLNAGTASVLATVAVGIEPGQVAVDESTDTVYVVNTYDGAASSFGDTGTVSIVDGSTDSVATTVGVGSGPEALAVDQSTGTAYVSNLDSGVGSAVYVISPNTTGVAPSLVVGDRLGGVAVNQATGELLVASTYPNDLLSINPGAAGGSIVGANPPPGTVITTLNPGVLSFVSAPANLTFPALTLDGTNETTSVSLPLDIGDNTGSGAGWNVTITSTQFSSGSATLPGSATSVNAAPSASCDTGVSCTPATLSSVLTYPVTVPAGSTAPTATRLYSAAAGSGMADQTISPDFTLAVPANAASGAYSADWTLSLVSGP